MKVRNRSLCAATLAVPLLAVPLLAATMLLSPSLGIGATKPPKSAPLLGAHPTTPAKSARLAFVKQRSNAIPLKPLKPGKTVNSLNRRVGKTIEIHRTLPK